VQTDAVKAVGNADLVIEAIVENLETKQRLFAELDKAAPRFLITSLIRLSLIIFLLWFNYLRQEVLRSVVFVRWLIGLFIRQCVRLLGCPEQPFRTGLCLPVMYLSFFFSQRVLRAPSTDRPETLPHDRNLA